MKAKTGRHENVPTLDFNSLYPNIMLTYFLDLCTIVLDERYADIPGLTYIDVVIGSTLRFRFVQNVPGIILNQLTELLASRKQSQAAAAAAESRRNVLETIFVQTLKHPSEDKKCIGNIVQMVKERTPQLNLKDSCGNADPSHMVDSCVVAEHPFCATAVANSLSCLTRLAADYTNHNSAQLEKKVASNSCFGVLSSPGKLFVTPIPACVTALGRRALHVAKNHAENAFVIDQSEIHLSFAPFMSAIGTPVDVQCGGSEACR